MRNTQEEEEYRTQATSGGTMTDWEGFFRDVKKPASFDNDMKSVDAFVKKHVKAKRNIAFVTVWGIFVMTSHLH